MFGEEGKGPRYALVLSAAAVACLILPAAAAATTRYAAPGGNASAAQCTSPVGPFCSIHEAAQGAGVLPADEVVITPGSYSDTAGDLGPGVVTPVAGNVHGAVGLARPVVTANMPTDGPFIVNTGVTLSAIEVDTADAVGNVQLQGGVVDGLIARSSRAGAIVCRHAFGTIRNSACLATGANSWALGVDMNASPTRTLTVRNVTAVATGSSSRGASYRFFAGPGSNDTVDIVNSIARGTTTNVVATAVQLNGFCPESVTVSLDYSNYASAAASAAIGCTTGAGSASVTAAGTLNNQTTAPVLAADGYHQVAGSITIDNGTLASEIGTTDIDGQARTVGAAPDMGADELRHPTSSAVSCDPTSIFVGETTTCSATVTDTAATSASPPSGSVSFGTGAVGVGSFGSGGVCTLAPSTATASSCPVTYTPSQVGTGTHQLTGSYGGGASHDPSQGTSTPLTVTEAPPTATPPTSPINSVCAKLRKKLKKAKKAHNRAKVRKLKKKLRRLGCR
jgi:hypothetical protein